MGHGQRRLVDEFGANDGVVSDTGALSRHHPNCNTERHLEVLGSQIRRRFPLAFQQETRTLSTFHPHLWGTVIQSPRSLKYEYELYVEREIEDYKDSVSRGALLKIGDEAVEVLRKQDQIALTEMVVWQEVDRLITKRLRLPTYATWKRRRLKMLEQYQRPEHWGIDPNAMLVRALSDSSDRHVLVAGAEREGPALYLAARGCAVTAVEPAEDAVERVVRAAEAAGLTERVRGYCADLGGWAPDVALHGVVCSPTAFAGLTMQDRARVIEVLQSATVDGGVHLVETIAAGTESMHGGFPLEELRSRYRGWTISVEKTVGLRETFMARKDAAVA